MVDALKILSIAGSDNTSGAGIQADIKASQYLGVYCLSVVTAITSQNSEKILKVFTIPENILASQLKITLQEYKVDAVKVGLVNNLATAELIYNFLKSLKKEIPIIVDPIFMSSTKKKFCNRNIFISINKKFSKLKPIFTPNFFEAKSLVKLAEKEFSIECLFKTLIKEYNSSFIITGGDSESKYSTDYIYIKNKVINLKSLKIKSSSTHGTGCAFSTALTIFLARGYDLLESTKKSKKFIERRIKTSPKLDIKYGPLL